MDIEDEAGSPWGDVPSRSSQTPLGSNGDKPQDDTATGSSFTTSSPTTSAPNTSASTTSAPVKKPGGRHGRGARKGSSQPTRLEAVDDSLGPLGPLSDSFQQSRGNDATPQQPASEDAPPELPQKEGQRQPQQSRQPPSSSMSSPPPSRGRTSRQPGAREDAGLEEYDENLAPQPGTSRPRFPPPVEPPVSDDRLTHPTSMSIEQAAKPSFTIAVGDPHKVGDLTSSHTMYQVRTKTTSKAYRNPSFEVSRRYRDFLWLFNQLHSNNPGIIVPAPPEKQAVGRFDSNFVEGRRAALEKMLNKTAAHPVLQHDGDLKLFLESESFTVDMKQRERKDPDFPPESKGMFGSLNLSVGGGTKFIERDDWFLDRRVYLDTLESQLRSLHNALNTTVGQRKGLAECASDLSQSLNNLSQVELSPTLSGPLASLSDLQLRIRDLYDRQAQQDILTLGIVIDEYVRMIGSIRKSFEQRQRSWHQFHTAEADLQKRRSALDKLNRQGRSQQDRLAQLQADVADAERRAHQAQLQFNDLGRVMRNEIERFEKEKVEDFRMGLETYLEGCVESQKEVIEIWETFLMQLDADDDEQESVIRSQGEGAQREPIAKGGPTAKARGNIEASSQAQTEAQSSEQRNPDEPSVPILQSERNDASNGPLAEGHEGEDNLPPHERNVDQGSDSP